MRANILTLFLGLLVTFSVTAQHSNVLDALLLEMKNSNISPDSIAIKYLSKIDHLPDSTSIEILTLFDGHLSRFSSQQIIDITQKKFAIISGVDRAPIWKEAIEVLEAKSTIDSTNLAFAINSLGEWYAHISENELAIQQFLRTISIFPENSLEMELGYSYNNLGSLLNRNGDPGTAIPFMNKAIYVFSHHLGSEHIYLSTMHNNLGMAYGRLKDSKNQEANLLKSLEIRQKTIPTCHDQMYEIRTNLGLYYKNKGEFKKSEEFIIKAMECANSNHMKGDERYVHLSSVLISLKSRNSEVYSEKDIEKAFIEAIAEGESRVGKHHSSLRDLYNNAGVFFYARKQPQKAVLYFESAIKSSFQSSKMINAFHLPTIAELKKNLNANLLLFTNLGSSYFNLYKANNEEQYLDLSFEVFELCSEISEKLKISIVQGSSRQNLKSQTRHGFILSNRTSFELFQLRKERIFLENIFANAEKIKSWELLERFTFTEQADSVMQTDIAMQISEMKDKLVFGNNNQLTDSLRLAYNFLLEKLKYEYPKYYEQMYGYEIITLEELQDLCRSKNESWVVYYQLPSEKFGSFLVTKDTIITVDKAFSNGHLKQQKEALFSHLDQKEWDFVEKAEQLYDTLIGPFSSHIRTKNLVIQGHTTLFNLPFEILIDRSNKSGELRERFIFEYLMHDHDISYMHSATMAHRLLNRSVVFKLPYFVAPVYLSDELRLKYSTEEVKQGIKEIGGLREDFTSLSNLLKNLSNHDHFHFAGHVFSSADIDSTYMLLREGVDTLFLKDMIEMDNDANLVILSGCESGIGKKSPEALIGPAYAFTFAGSPNIISSLWKNNDESSARLFGFFYRNMKNGSNSVSALTEAKIEYLKAVPIPERHPIYWASFTHYGMGVHFEKGKSNLWLYLVTIGIAVGSLLVVRKYNNRKIY